MAESGFQVNRRRWVGRGLGATVRSAAANTFLCEARPGLSAVVNMCILSNKIQLPRLPWAGLGVF